MDEKTRRSWLNTRAALRATGRDIPEERFWRNAEKFERSGERAKTIELVHKSQREQRSLLEVLREAWEKGEI